MKRSLSSGVVAVALALVLPSLPSLATASSGTLLITSSTTPTEDHHGNIQIVGDNIPLDCATTPSSGAGYLPSL